jgi:hypothetical protein
MAKCVFSAKKKQKNKKVLFCETKELFFLNNH